MNQQILVISDLKEAAIGTLRTSVFIAKKLKKDIFFLSVSKPTEVVTQQSQLSANRSINIAHLKSVEKMKELIAHILEDSNIKIDFEHTIGNVKNEVLNHITEYKPELVILGKRKPKVIDIIGDKLTNFILKNYNGPVIIADKSKEEKLLDRVSFAKISGNISENGNQLIKTLLLNEDEDSIILKDHSSKISSQTQLLTTLTEKNYDFVILKKREKLGNLNKVIPVVECSFILVD